jgi:hypothetical protein
LVRCATPEWWEPTANEYLDRVPKALIARALCEASMCAEAVAKTETLIAGKRWLPMPLRQR